MFLYCIVCQCVTLHAPYRVVFFGLVIASMWCYVCEIISPEIVFFGLVIASMRCYVCEIISPESRVFLGETVLKVIAPDSYDPTTAGLPCPARKSK